MSENIGICATGIYEPVKVVNIEDVKEIEAIPEEKIRKLGIKGLRVASEKEHPSTMAIAAAKDAIQNAGIDPKDIDIVVYTQAFFSDHLMWADYAEVQNEIGAVNADSFKIFQHCNGTVVALDYAYSKMLADKSLKYILIVGVEKYCKPLINRWLGTTTAFLGDGASAAIIKRGEKSNLILGTNSITDGTYNRIWQASCKGGTALPFSDEITLGKGEILVDYVKSGGLYQTDDSMRKIVVDSLIAKNKQVLSTIVSKANTDVRINKMVTINMGINWISQIAEVVNIPLKNTSAYIAKSNGHMGTCDLMFNLHRMVQDGKIASGDDVVLFSSGAGYSSGCILIRYL